MIRFVPVAIVSPTFKWMADFWSYMQKRVYDTDAPLNSLLTIVKQNRLDDPVYDDVDWDTKGIPYKMVESIYNYVDSTNPNCIVINVFSAVKQVVDEFDDEDTLCITDMDVIPMGPINVREVEENEVLCFSGYENWHMFIADKSKQNYNKIQHLLTHNEEGYMNGGFVPILIKVKTFKKIVDDVIKISETIIESNEPQTWKWWSCMTGFSIACHNHKINMVGVDNTYIPNFNELQPQHSFTHYSVDPIFNKHTFPNHSIQDYPKNGFYRFVKDWITSK